MTEDEAKTKWCPFTRVAKPDVGVGYNRWVDGIGESTASNSRCIGSACMAWRWSGLRRKDLGGKLYDTDDAVEARRNEYDNRVVARLGCCGLAGKP